MAEFNVYELYPKEYCSNKSDVKEMGLKFFLKISKVGEALTVPGSMFQKQGSAD